MTPRQPSRPVTPADRIRVRGARQNNLRNVDVDLPRGAMTAITGPSGSGKSSLAVDTLYAEGQRRYLEGVSAHARRFLERIPRPDVDLVEGLSPAVSLEQRAGARSARSTVGTSTEVHDYLRLLFARVGRVHCDRGHGEVPRITVAAAVEEWAGRKGLRVRVAFPAGVGTGGKTRAVRALQARGYLRVMADDEVVDLERAPARAKTWDVLQDRLPADRRARLAEALEAAFAAGHGRASIHPEGGEARRYRLGRACAVCDADYPEPDPRHFSFNSPAGACPDCQGFGYTLEFDPGKIVPDEGKTIDEGAIVPWAGRWRGTFHKRLAASAAGRAIPRDVPWRDLDPGVRELLLQGRTGFKGVLPFLERLARKKYKPGARFLVKRYQSPQLCGSCGGDRLQPAGRRVRLAGATLPEWTRRSVSEVRVGLADLSLSRRERDTVRSLLADLEHRLKVLERVGLGYLGLDRLTRTLSGGEAQRIELAQALGARLVDALYVLDEPTIGLHPRDTGRLLEVLRDLTRGGNTVLVVEHDLDVIRACDWIVDLGPGAGRQGGRVVFCGDPAQEPVPSASPTLELLRPGERRPRGPRAEPTGWLRVRGATLHNLKQVDADIPCGVVVGVCGVSGSGKSSLVADTLVPLLGKTAPGLADVTDDERGRLVVEAALKGFSVVDQSPLARSARSVPASYVGAWNGIRSLFAALPESKHRGFTPGIFSFNVAGGRCETCRGEGEVTVDMDFMPDVRFTCEACRGTRFGAEAREPRYRGVSIVDVLGLTVDRALALFAAVPSIARPLWWMQRVGLGYLVLGQPARTLSGGEAQRLKLTRELAGGAAGKLVVLDEPTVGLHATEVARLVDLFREMVKAGNTVLVIEHHLEVLAACDWLLELGPDGGEAGGEIIAAGPPESVVQVPGSRIATYLRPLLSPGRAGADLG